MPKGKYERTEEIRQKISESNLGKHHTKEAKEKMRLAKLGKYIGKDNPMYGKHHSEKSRLKMGKSIKMNAMNNPNFGMKGKCFSEEHKRKLSEARKGKYAGNNCPSWKGGVSFEPYSPEFDRQLKELIRQRDGYKCQLCGMPECENIEKLTIHHIDYIKKNCLPDNLIALCKICNSKVNFNRDYWTKYFKEIKVKKNKLLEVI